MSKNVIVTGAVGGIGTEICKRLHNDGFKVIAAYRTKNVGAAKLWQAKMIKDGFSISIFPVDVECFSSCQELADLIKKEFGTIDILINNAGITSDATMKKITQEQWNNVLRTNLDSVFNMSKAVFADMCDNGWGRIVNISSINGQKGQFGQVNYAAAKAGIYGITKSLALEGARKGVTVNSISPGYVGTQMVTSMPGSVIESIVKEIPVGRLGKPEEIANAVAFLVGNYSGFITGTDISINGGQYM